MKPSRTADEVLQAISAGVQPVPADDLLAIAVHLAETSSDKQTALLMLGILRYVIATNVETRKVLYRMQDVTSRFELCR